MEIPIKDNLQMEKEMEEEFMNIQMEMYMMECGDKIKKMEQVYQICRLEINMKENGIMEENMEQEDILLQMVMFMKDILLMD